MNIFISSAWVWNDARNDMFDYIPVVTDRMVLAIMKNSIRRTALDLCFRPFTKNVWITIGSITVFIIIFLLTLVYLRKIFPNQNATWNETYRALLFVAWSCFLLIEIHFEGTLTMFLTTEIDIPFHSVKDVMRDYPDWRLLMRSGFEVYYIDYVDAGDEDYIIYWDRVKREPEENSFIGIDDVINNRQDERVVIHDLQGAIDAHTKYEDGNTMEHLTIFNKGRSEWYGMIVTENSPLGPMLQHGSKDMHERGVFNYLQRKWLKRCDTCRPLEDHSSAKTVLNLNQVSFLFFILGNAMVISLIILLFENCQHSKSNELNTTSTSILSEDEEQDSKYKAVDENAMKKNNRGQNIKEHIFHYVWNN